MLSPGKLFGLAILAALAVYATWPGTDTMDYTTCEPKAGFSHLSASIYGRFFWEQALERARALAGRKTMEDILRSAERQTKQRNQSLEEIYKKYPKMAPTPDERAAQRLREQADQIEQRESLNRLYSMEREITTNALHCEQVIVQKLRNM